MVKNSQPKTSRKLKYKLVLLCVLGIVLLFTVFLGIKAYLDTPRNLGPKLDYIGSSDYGCPSILLIFICDSGPGVTYYFATDMSINELKDGYFIKAHYSGGPELFGGSGIFTTTDNHDLRYTYKFLDFKNSVGQKFSFTYYDDKAIITKEAHLKSTDKTYIISISKEHYSIAKSAL